MNENISKNDFMGSDEVDLPEIQLSANMEAELDAIKIPDIPWIDGTNAGSYFMERAILPATKSFFVLKDALFSSYFNHESVFRMEENSNFVAMCIATDCWCICREALKSTEKGIPYGRIIGIMLTRLSSIVADCGLFPSSKVSYGAEDIEKQMAMIWIHLMEKNLLCECIAKKVETIRIVRTAWASEYAVSVLNNKIVNKETTLMNLAADLLSILHGKSALDVGVATLGVLESARITNMFLTEEEAYERQGDYHSCKGADARSHPHIMNR